MKDFAILGRYEAVELVDYKPHEAAKFTHLVSFTDATSYRPTNSGLWIRDGNLTEVDHPVQEWFDQNGKIVLSFAFDDVDDIDFARHNGYTVPTVEDVQRLINAAKAWPDDATVLFQCEAGRSRSTAAAIIAFAARRPGAWKMAEVEARRRRKFEEPNQLMMAYAKDILEPV